MTDQTFTVKDRRHSTPDGQAREESAQGPPGRSMAGKSGPETRNVCEGAPTMPEVNFSTFIFSLSTSALIYLGELPDPMTRQTCQNLGLAKQNIDILGVLQGKTRGNLDPDEDQLLTNLLYELRMKYVAAVKR